MTGSIIGEREVDLRPARECPSRLILALRVVALRTKLPLPTYPSTSSGAISLQSETLAALSKTSLALERLPSFECRLGVRAGGFKLKLSVDILAVAFSGTGGTMVAPADVGTVCITKNFRVALASPIV